MTVALGTPRFRAFDANGDPLASGLLYSYEQGTSTPKATYTSSTGLTENANPVVLDANGGADVWLQGNYKLVLKDSTAATTFWTVDGYPGLDSTTQAEETLTPESGDAVVTTTSLVPQGGRLIAVTARVTTGFGTSQSLTGLHIGDSFNGNLNVSRWGADIALALDTTTTAANWTEEGQPIAKTGVGEVSVTAVGGLFDGTGAIKIRATYETFAAPS